MPTIVEKSEAVSMPWMTRRPNCVDAAKEVGHAVEVVEDEPSAQGGAVDEDRREIRADRFCLAVLRDDPDERNTCVEVDAPEHRLQHRAADVVEVDVDALRAGRLQR